MTSDAELPAWAREDAFPEAGPGWGWVDRKGRRYECPSFDDLSRTLSGDSGARAELVWTPDSPGLVLPEEVPALLPALKTARIRWAEWDIQEGKRQMIVFGAVFFLLLYLNGFRPDRIRSSGTMGLAALLFLILGFLPWYQGGKRLARARKWAAGDMAEDAAALRFETWLAIQEAPLTRLLLGLLALAGLVQALVEIHGFNVRHQFSGFASFIGLAKFLFSFSGLDGAGMTIANAGLTKGPFTDWWRLLTAPFLHGHWLHWLMNASALAYLGKRVETFARWPHLVMVFAISAWIGGEASLRFSPTTPSVGASGGLMGLLGFLLVFETLHRRLVPESSRRRLLAGVLLTGVIGFVFRHFIDNAAHLGGLVAGMVYAALVFPRSSSPHRPRATTTDVLCGGAALGLVVSAAILACIKMA